MKRTVLAALAAVFLIGSGVAQGVWSGRWTTSAALDAASARLADVPRQVGDWTSVELPMDPREIKVAAFTGVVSRRYVNAKKNQAVNVLLACGRVGPLAVHTPEMCFVANGFEQMTAPQRVLVKPVDPARPDSFWMTDFRKPASTAGGFERIFYGWSNGRNWATPDHDPRWTFATSPFLYKLYASRDLLTAGEPTTGDPVVAFLDEFTPVLARTLQPPH